MAKEKSEKEKSMLLALLLFLGAGGLVFAYLDSDGKRSGAAALTKTKQYEAVVNKHLMMTNERIELEKRRMDAENTKLLNEASTKRDQQKAYSNDERLDLSMENRGAEVAKEIGRGPKEITVESPHEVVQQELYNEQLANQSSQAYREQYARQFIENARRGGYEVKLSADFSKVLSVKPIRNPSNDFEVFGTSSGGAQ
jgi:hypothetical protein